LQTNRTIPIKNPDITISDNKQVTYILTNVALSGDRNVIKKRAEKILKYEDITIGIQRTWNVKAQVIPVITDCKCRITATLNTLEILFVSCM